MGAAAMRNAGGGTDRIKDATWQMQQQHAAAPPPGRTGCAPPRSTLARRVSPNWRGPGPRTTYQVQADRGNRFLRCLTPTMTGFPATDLALPGGEWLRDLLLEDTDDLATG